MEETHFFITELLNCLSWVALTGVLIYAVIKIVHGHNMVKIEIAKKLRAETRKIENETETRTY